ncbi:MAG: DUF5987 family protein [Desulfobacterales bacterium]|jgi:hypothetical protein
MSPDQLSRREFLKRLTVICGSGAAGISYLAPGSDAAEAVDFENTWLQEKTLQAFADTIIPGPNSDPEGSPGGLEAGALEVLYDPYYGLTPVIDLLTRNLNRSSLWWCHRLFKDLDLNQRTAIVLFKDNFSLSKLVYEHAEMLVKLSFYGAIINDVGTDYIYFPGPAHGYSDYSFKKQFAQPQTEDGNLP